MNNKLLLTMFLTSSMLFSNCGTTSYTASANKDSKIEERLTTPKHSDIIDENNLTLKVLNGNLWGLPEPFSVDKNNRLDRFLSVVHQYLTDIVCLQEVWMKKDLGKIQESLNEYDMFTSNKGAMYNYSGLVIFSKYAVSESEFHKFDNHKDASFIESLSSKGYLRIKLAGTDISITDTHIYCPKDSAELNISYSQFETLKNSTKGGIEILVGDFNLPKEDIEKLNNGQFIIEKDTLHTYSPENIYARSGVNASAKCKGNKIDHVLVNLGDNTGNNLFMTSELIKTPVSDHYMMNYTLYLSNDKFLIASEKGKFKGVITKADILNKMY